MTLPLAVLAAFAAATLAWFAQRTTSVVLSRKDAASVFIALPLIFAAWAVWKSNSWLAGLALLLVSTGWIAEVCAGRRTKNGTTGIPPSPAQD